MQQSITTWYTDIETNAWAVYGQGTFAAHERLAAGDTLGKPHPNEAGTKGPLHGCAPHVRCRRRSP